MSGSQVEPTLLEESLCFGGIDSTARRLDADRYTVLCTRRNLALYRIASAKTAKTRATRIAATVRAAEERHSR